MVSIIRENAYVVHGVETLLTETNHVGVKAKGRLLKTFDLMPVGSVSERCKKGRVKLCGNGSVEANFLKCFSFCTKIYRKV